MCVCLLLALWRGRSYNGRESAVRCTRTPKKSCNILKQLNEMKRVNTWERQRQTAGRLARSASMRIIMAAARLAGGLSCLRTGRLLLPAGLRVGGVSSQVRGLKQACLLARARRWLGGCMLLLW